MRQTCFWYYDPISFNARTWVVWNFAFPSYLFIFTWFFSPLKHPFELTSFHFTLSLSFFIFLPPSPTHTHTHAHTHTRRTYNSIFLRLTSSYTFHLTWHKPLKAFFLGGGRRREKKFKPSIQKQKKKPELLSDVKIPNNRLRRIFKTVSLFIKPIKKNYE